MANQSLPPMDDDVREAHSHDHVERPAGIKGGFRLCLTNGQWWWSPGMYRLHGYPPDRWRSVRPSGRLLLAHSDAAWLRTYLASVNLKVPMEQAMTRAGLRQELEQIRAEGLSCSFDRYTRGLASVAAPVLDASGLCVASLNVAGPTERFRNELDFLKATVREVATRASGLISDIRRA